MRASRDDRDAWARELREIRPLALMGKIPPRPILLVHGEDDVVVPPQHVRELADAAEGMVELRLLSGAGHRLRHDPRAVAALLGWLSRQGESSSDVELVGVDRVAQGPRRVTPVSSGFGEPADDDEAAGARGQHRPDRLGRDPAGDEERDGRSSRPRATRYARPVPGRPGLVGVGATGPADT